MEGCLCPLQFIVVKMVAKRALLLFVQLLTGLWVAACNLGWKIRHSLPMFDVN
jgi:hypothetical protein